jgi:predicted lipoprotein with Yx(FWY)xxD motif
MASPIVDWTIVTRDDGTKQWAFKGKPIYRYADEVQVAETLGEHVEGRWHAAVLEPPPAKPGWVKFHHTDGGEVLTNAQGYTIYTFDEGRRGLGGNAMVVIDNPDKWVPVLASADDKPIGMWTIVEAKPGERQWAQNGLPLYTCKEDLAPGDVRGVRFGDRRFKPIMRNGLPMPGT